MHGMSQYLKMQIVIEVLHFFVKSLPPIRKGDFIANWEIVK